MAYVREIKVVAAYYSVVGEERDGEAGKSKRKKIAWYRFPFRKLQRVDVTRSIAK